MNWIDRVVSYISPTAGLKRMAARQYSRFVNSGYSEGGASTTKKSLRGYIARSSSPEEDIDANLPLLRSRSRDMFMNAPLGRSAIKTARTNIVGSGLRLKSRIDSEFLGLTEEQAEEWERNVEREFALWASSVHCDALRMNNFYSMQQVVLMGWLMNGDSFTIIKHKEPTPYMPYGLRLHNIEADRVSSPSCYKDSLGTVEARNPDNGNKIISGIEINDDGEVVAYWVSNRYPQAAYTGLTDNQIKWTRIEAYGQSTGRPNVLHVMEPERAEQRRGVPMLAPVIEPLKQITRYTEAELMAAVVSGFFTVFIKTEGPSSEVPIGEMIPQDQRISDGDDTVYELGNGAINILRDGEEIQIANPARPNTNFDMFVNALARYIGAALEIPQDLLQKSFNSSYSASRAALLEAWKMFRMRRAWLAQDFCQPVFEEWLAEAVAIGRVKAPGFFTDPAIRKAWSTAEWNGPAPGQVDPVKEVDAAIKRINNGLSTRERETMELTGGDFDRNIKQLKRESALMKEVNDIDE